ncbi:MAG: leucine-rich repeat protein [Firmicutes bacterium]|nr:leucine-rich repeat protein [Bacillota bacterium]
MKRTILLCIMMLMLMTLPAGPPVLADGGYQMYDEPEYWYKEIGEPVPVSGGNIYTLWGDRLIGSDKTITEAVIPDTVASIGRIAFSDCTWLEKIVIPASVTDISNDCVFLNCQSLTEIVVDPANPAFCSVNGVLFSKDKSRLLYYPEGKRDASWTLPAGVQTVDSMAFSRCRYLKSWQVEKGSAGWTASDGVLYNRDMTELISYPAGKEADTFRIPETVSKIDQYAFSGCPVRHIDFPAGLEEIGELSFLKCVRLEEVELGSQVTAIQKNAFEKCLSLQSVRIGNSPCKIDNYAFENCNALEYVEIGNGCREIDSSAFRGCYALKEAVLPDTMKMEEYYWDGLFHDFHFRTLRITDGSRRLENTFYRLGFPEEHLYYNEDNFNDSPYFRIELPESITFVSQAVLPDSRQLSIYYRGSEAQWKKIENEDGPLYNYYNKAEIHYNSGLPERVPGWRDVFVDDAFAEEAQWTKQIQAMEYPAEDLLSPYATMNRGEAVLCIWKARGCPEPSMANPFKDISESDPCYKAALWAVEKGITAAFAEGKFGPSEICSSQHFLLYLWRLAGKPGDSGDASKKWYEDAVAWAKDLGIQTDDIEMSGIWDSCFRADALRYLYRAYQAGVLQHFFDVPSDAYFNEPVSWAVRQGITKGTSPDTFGPSDSCTRGQAVTFLWRAAGSEPVSGVKNPFKDVKPSDYYYNAVLWAYDNGITNGISDDLFGPGATCSRGQIVTFLWRTMGKPAGSASVNFSDVPEKAYYHGPVQWAVEDGVTNGTSATTFSPDLNCTRAQIATFLFRALNSTEFEYDGHRYACIIKDVSWEKAARKAKEAGGRLAVFESEAEWQALTEQIRRAGLQNHCIYVGGRRDDGDTAYRWIGPDGRLSGPVLNSDASWTNGHWMTGEPNFRWSDVEETVMEMEFNKAQGSWVFNDVSAQTVVSRCGFLIEF